MSAKMCSLENSEFFHLLQVLTEHLSKTMTTDKDSQTTVYFYLLSQIIQNTITAFLYK